MGGNVRLIGNVGNDDLGSFLLHQVAKSGADTSLVSSVDQPTGAATILVLPDGENSIVVSPGANSSLTPDSVAERLQGITSNDFLMCQLETPVDTVAAALQIAKNAGATTILDPVPAGQFTTDLLEFVDYLTPNETEASTILNTSIAPGSNESVLREIAKELHNHGAHCVILTLGSSGCYYDDQGTSGIVPGIFADTIDTTGAGDTFAGALAVALINKEPLPQALLTANAAAALSITKSGAQSSMPSLDDVQKLLERTGKAGN
jgi:ribokinase